MKTEGMKELIKIAKGADLVGYLVIAHPGTVHIAPHPAYGVYCYRSYQHDSLTFYEYTDTKTNRSISRYHRYSNCEDGDPIAYLQKYEGYSFLSAVVQLVLSRTDLGMIYSNNDNNPEREREISWRNRLIQALLSENMKENEEVLENQLTLPKELSTTFMQHCTR